MLRVQQNVLWAKRKWWIIGHQKNANIKQHNIETLQKVLIKI